MDSTEGAFLIGELNSLGSIIGLSGTSSKMLKIESFFFSRSAAIGSVPLNCPRMAVSGSALACRSRNCARIESFLPLLGSNENWGETSEGWALSGDFCSGSLPSAKLRIVGDSTHSSIQGLHCAK